MKLLNRLTLKHLFMNKKRTIVTIIGITLSTALMVGIGLLVSTFLHAMIDDVVKSSGSYHAYYDGITKEEVEQVGRHIDVSASYSYGVIGFANISSTNTYKPYLYVVSADDTYFAHEDLLEGRYPTNDNEIVIPNHLLTNGEVELSIGDEITLQIGPRVSGGEEIYSNDISLIEVYDENDEGIVDETIVPYTTKTYQIVGVIDRSNAEDYSAPGYMVFTTKSEDIKTYRSFVEYKNIKKTYEITEDICESLNDNVSCNVHDNLLYYYGVSRYSNINRTITSLLAIVLTLLSVGSIIVIYNSFAISTMERKKSFGLYSSLGATPRQIKYTVFFEAFLVGFIGIFLGVLGAFVGIYILVQVLNYLIADSWGMTLIFTANPYYIFIPILFMILVVYFSAFFPARRSSKVTAIEMIRENDEIKIPRKKVKTPKWIRKIFGMEGEIALKNMKRNKRKYRITLLSLFISIVLFISFSTYLKYGLSVVELNELPNYDILVASEDTDVLEEIKMNDLVDNSHSFYSNTLFYEILDESMYQKEYFDFMKNYYWEDYHKVPVAAIILEDDDYQKLTDIYHVSSNTILFLNELSYTDYYDGNRLAYHTPIFTQNMSKFTFCNGDGDICKEMPIYLVNEEEKSTLFNEYMHDNTIQTVFLSNSIALESGLFVDTEIDETGNSITTNYTDRHQYLTIQSNEYESLYQELDKNYGATSNVSISSPTIDYQNEKNSLLAMKILMYGFITLVTLIGVTSVFNTIYTSIHLRRKEFAMLRSVGLSPKGFQKMIFFESLFFGLKSLLYALPVSFIFIFLISRSMGYSFQFGGILIPWGAIFIAIVGVFLLILITMMYSTRKIKKENILTSLQDENI